jgi:hypothetical protein
MSSPISDGLRGWARGLYPAEAAVELLLRCFGGRFAGPGWPWLQADARGGWWLDPDVLDAESGVLSSGEQSMLAVVASLAGGPRVDLADVVTGLDRVNLELVLAAVSHAGGSHDHSYLRHGPDGSASVERLEPLFGWPDDDPDDDGRAA